MTELDVISLDSAKNWLSLDLTDTDPDEDVTRLIKTAINWVETYTCYRMWERDEVVTTYKKETFLSQYPITNFTVTDQSDVPATYYSKIYPQRLMICAPINSKITLDVGYSDTTSLPGQLLDACYKLITYLYENRDAYEMALPLDVQILINQLRRRLI